MVELDDQFRKIVLAHALSELHALPEKDQKHVTEMAKNLAPFREILPSIVLNIPKRQWLTQLVSTCDGPGAEHVDHGHPTPSETRVEVHVGDIVYFPDCKDSPCEILHVDTASGRLRIAWLEPIAELLESAGPEAFVDMTNGTPLNI